MKVIVAGDFCVTSKVAEYITEGRCDDVFGDVKPYISDADFSIVNFEFAIADDSCKPIAKCGPNIKGNALAIDVLKYAGFKACTLANNHILDYGELCCIKTKKLLEEKDILTVGAGKNADEAGRILYFTHGDSTLAVLNCCEHEFSVTDGNSAGTNPLNPVAQWYKIHEARQKADFVLVIVHGGTEFCQIPSPRMKETYRFFIDAGADVVVNHHQHCYSGYERYKDKLIFYGIGNFCFPAFSHSRGTWHEGFLAEINFGKTLSFAIKPYIQCKDRIGIRFMNQHEESAFKKSIAELNSIILNDKLLANEFRKRCENSHQTYRIALEPYTNRIFKALFVRGLLPSFLSRKHLLALRNYIECESHAEGLKYTLKKMTSNE